MSRKKGRLPVIGRAACSAESVVVQILSKETNEAVSASLAPTGASPRPIWLPISKCRKGNNIRSLV